jgi:hypothetical protein
VLFSVRFCSHSIISVLRSGNKEGKLCLKKLKIPL